MVSCRPMTWRVQNIPSDFTEAKLVSSFHSDDRPHIRVRSLVPDVNNYDGDGTLTATILFSPPEPGEPRIEDDDIDVDKDFIGFTPLNNPAKDVCADIIAVTGLAGHAFGSWAHSSQKMWLRDYLPKDVQNRARILIYGYKSQLYGAESAKSIISDYESSFTQNLMVLRDHPSCRDRPLILIGHSLGALIIKEAITDLDPNVRSRLPVRALFFFGAPHNGLEVAALETLVKGRPTETLVSELRRESPTLTGLSSRFRHVAKDIIIHTYYESRPTNTVAQGPDGRWARTGEPLVMVDRTSALLNIEPEKTRTPVDGDHKEIARLRRGQGGVYPNVLHHMKDALQSASEQFQAAARAAKAKAYENAKYRGRSSRFEGAEFQQQYRYQVPNLLGPSELHDRPETPPHHSTDAPFYSERILNPEKFDRPEMPPYRSTEAPFHNERILIPEQIDRPITWTSSERAALKSPFAPPDSPPGRTRALSNHASRLSEPQVGFNAPVEDDASISRDSQLSNSATLLSQSDSMQQLQSERVTDDMERMNLEQVGPPSRETRPGSGSLERPGSRSSSISIEMSPSTCDGCDIKITGIRHKCLECPDWTYCPECFGDASTLHPKHQFEIVSPEKSTRPSVQNGHDKEPTVSLGLSRCNKCKEAIDIDDYFYQCIPCGNYDVCCCRTCQGTNTSCLIHDQPAMKRTLISYGNRKASVPYIDPKPLPEDSLLVRAVKEQDITLLDKVARDQRLVNQVDADGRTPLHIAAILGLDVGARFILMYGGSLEPMDNHSYTPLGLAILAKQLKMAHILLEKGANAEGIGRLGNTALHLACATDSAELVEMVLKKTKNIDTKNDYGHTSLFRSAWLEELEISSLLVAAGANVNTSSKDHLLVLLGTLAADNRPKGLKFLLDHGAELETTDSQSRTALFRAAAAGNHKICRMLLERGAKLDVIAKGETLTDSGTPLGQAACNGHLNAVKVLVKAGADVEAKDDIQRTPLYRAARNDREEITRYLLEQGAKPDAQKAVMVEQWLIRTPLQIAAQFGYLPSLKALVEHGADLENKDMYGYTALFMAVSAGHEAVCRYLVIRGADANTMSDNGHTLLSLAARMGHLNLVNWLLKEVRVSAKPSAMLKNGKWKYLLFDSSVTKERSTAILELLRAYKHVN